MTAVIEARGLGKRYGTHHRHRWALADCTLRIPAGHIAGLVGPNGAGKTTLLHLVTGLLAPTTGTIEVAGGLPAATKTQLARVGFVAQDAPVYAGLSVADHLRLGAHLNPRWDARLARQRISKLGLDPRQKAGRLSGGQRAQLALTLAIAKRPQLLILDEPVASLDPLARRDFLRDLTEATGEHQMSVMLSSHLVADLERVCDYLIVLAAGRVQAAGEVTGLLNAYRNATGAQAGLEDMVLAYMSQAAGPHRPGRAAGGITMIWLTWRQFRAQAIAAAVALAVLAVIFGVTGPHLAHLYDISGLATCRANCAALTNTFVTSMKADAIYPVLFIAGLGILYLTPALIGLFWGAPLVTRELEAGTFRLAWNQSVTRTRWMAVKLALIGLAAMVTTGLLSLLITWWAGPIDRAGGFPVSAGTLTRFSPLLFGARDIAPVGYAAFAFALGVTAGVLVRRLLPAMVITLAVFLAVQVIMPNLVRPHLLPPVTATEAVTVNLSTAIVGHNGTIAVPVTGLPGAWIFSNQTITPSGRVFVLPDVPACASGTQQQCDAWFATQHLRRQISYQPASRYWAFQWYETAIFLALALALAGFCVWWIRHRRLA